MPINWALDGIDGIRLIVGAVGLLKLLHESGQVQAQDMEGHCLRVPAHPQGLQIVQKTSGVPPGLLDRQFGPLAINEVIVLGIQGIQVRGQGGGGQPYRRIDVQAGQAGRGRLGSCRLGRLGMLRCKDTRWPLLNPGGGRAGNPGGGLWPVGASAERQNISEVYLLIPGCLLL